MIFVKKTRQLIGKRKNVYRIMHLQPPRDGFLGVYVAWKLSNWSENVKNFREGQLHGSPAHFFAFSDQFDHFHGGIRGEGLRVNVNYTVRSWPDDFGQQSNRIWQSLWSFKQFSQKYRKEHQDCRVGRIYKLRNLLRKLRKSGQWAVKNFPNFRGYLENFDNPSTHFWRL